MLTKRTKRNLTRFCFAALMVAFWANAHHAHADEATIKDADKWQHVAVEQTFKLCEKLHVDSKTCFNESTIYVREGKQIAWDYLHTHHIKSSEAKTNILLTFGAVTHTFHGLCTSHSVDVDKCENQATKEFFKAIE